MAGGGRKRERAPASAFQSLDSDCLLAIAQAGGGKKKPQQKRGTETVVQGNICKKVCGSLKLSLLPLRCLLLGSLSLSLCLWGFCFSLSLSQNKIAGWFCKHSGNAQGCQHSSGRRRGEDPRALSASRNGWPRASRCTLQSLSAAAASQRRADAGFLPRSRCGKR